MAANRPLLDLLASLVSSKNATPAQIALAWLLALKPSIVPIPGTRKLHRPKENLGAVAIRLTSAEVHEINAATSKIEVHGARGTGQEQYC